ncbi:hypothetical protein H4R34_005315 [Dimargaris verticillata]|uniref:Uncharacterized protein n=1 Tax=Dimargaris verticillata TaxID=2761393 RepID=A0A9W8B2L1_9FUNG|nr:hypothetical protein H4R34_005315 [Dimargaris verticillata]
MEAKVVDSFVQSIEAIVEIQMNRLYDAVVAYIQQQPCDRNRDTNQRSEDLMTIIESELMAGMPTCLNYPDILTLSRNLMREAESTIVRHGFLRRKCKGFSASLSRNNQLKEQFKTTKGTNCLKIFRQQRQTTLLDRSDATIQEYNARLLRYQKYIWYTVSQ